MSELRSTLDDLAGIDLDDLAPDALLDLVGELSTAANRVAAVLTSAVRAADSREAHRRDGAVSMKSWLRQTRRRSSRPGVGCSSSPRPPPPSLQARSVPRMPG